MYLRGDISILVPAVFSKIVAILTAPAVGFLYIFIFLTVGDNSVMIFEENFILQKTAV
jgi:hypothetical protein